MSSSVPGPAGAPHPWWRSAVLYQIYPRSFADSDRDGQGDLEGIIQHLDHLAWLGVDGIWLNPITPSPNADWGYDVSDYRDIDPDFGDLDTLDRLVAAAGDRGIRVILDLVPNHTSDRHPWFLDARSSRAAPHRDWYVWADARPDGSPPNNWVSVFGGPAWTWDETTQQYYLHNFLPEQPDLNWWNEEVRAAFDDILRSWFDRGISGFRIDVAHGIIKDLELRDNPLATPDDAADVRALGQRHEFNLNRPEVHEVLRRWRAIADAYVHEPILVGETWVQDIQTLMRFYGDGNDELHLALNVPFIFAELGSEMRAIVEQEEAAIPEGAWPTWTGSNHDAGRFATRWCGGDDRKIRAAIVIVLTLRGTPILYYGDEIGMSDVPVPRDRIKDPVGIRGWPDDPGRDRARTPMPWTSEAGGGFTAPGVEPWLPSGDVPTGNVADQRDDPGSVLTLVRDLIWLRRDRDDLSVGRYAAIEAPAGIWAWRRGQGTCVLVNHTASSVDMPVDAGEVLLGTRREREGERVVGRLSLEPWEALVIAQQPVA
jgi:alpha-glucosidase